LKKLVISAFLAAALTSPVLAANKSKAEPEIFVTKADKIIKGERHITAVREDGRKIALVKVNHDGQVSATVDGKPVKAVLKGL
jgi:hypothetical protein